MGALKLFLVGLGIAMVLEGLPYFVSPGAVRGYLRQIGALSNAALRLLGLALCVAGLVLAWLAVPG